MDVLTYLINEPFISGIFLFVALICLALELFLPTGGILGFISIACTVFGIYGLFHQGHTVVAFLAMVFSLVSFWATMKFMMRKLDFTASLPPETANSVDHRIAGLVGREGVTITPLRPAGMALIDGRKVDVMTPGDFIEKDVPIRVVDNSGNRVVVRQVESRSSSP